MKYDVDFHREHPLLREIHVPEAGREGKQTGGRRERGGEVRERQKMKDVLIDDTDGEEIPNIKTQLTMISTAHIKKIRLRVKVSKIFFFLIFLLLFFCFLFPCSLLLLLLLLLLLFFFFDDPNLFTKDQNIQAHVISSHLTKKKKNGRLKIVSNTGSPDTIGYFSFVIFFFFCSLYFFCFLLLLLNINIVVQGPHLVPPILICPPSILLVSNIFPRRSLHAMKRR